MNGIVRQGDVWIIPLSPAEKKANTRSQTSKGSVKSIFPAYHTQVRAKGDLILAAGEATGHHHRIARKRGVKLYRRGDSTLLHVPKSGATVTHEEHAPLDIPAGDFKVVIAREYVPKAAPRRVYD